MGVYGFITCEDCEIQVFIGKRIRRPDGTTERFQTAPTEDGTPLNSANTQLNRVLWKFLADHTDHRIRIFTDTAVGGEELDRLLGFTELADDPESADDISFADYLRDWPG